MKQEIRPMVRFTDPEKQKREEEKINKEINDYLICYYYDVYSPDSPYDGIEAVKDWDIIKGRTALINFIKSMVEDNDISYIDVDSSFILVDVEGITLGDRITLREFIEHVNTSENEDEHILCEEKIK